MEGAGPLQAALEDEDEAVREAEAKALEKLRQAGATID